MQNRGEQNINVRDFADPRELFADLNRMVDVRRLVRAFAPLVAVLIRRIFKCGEQFRQIVHLVRNTDRISKMNLSC